MFVVIFSIKYCLNVFLNALWSDIFFIDNGKLFRQEWEQEWERDTHTDQESKREPDPQAQTKMQCKCDNTIKPVLNRANICSWT